jgi:hypothetical protein
MGQTSEENGRVKPRARPPKPRQAWTSALQDRSGVGRM